MKKSLCIASLIAAAVIGTTNVQAEGRDYISIVGSSTVYPFSTVVAEHFGRSSHFKTPKVESTGSGGGLKMFCQGVGVENPDITNSSRRIKASEVELCASNGVKNIVEVLVGYDGIVIANSQKTARMRLTVRDLYLALAKDVPNPNGTESVVPNPYTTWKDVNPSLPNTKIEVLGPPPTSGTRDAFVELVMDAGCSKFEWINTLSKTDSNRFKTICQTVREDGTYVEAGENDNLIVQKLDANPSALGIFGFSFLDQNSDKVHGSLVEGAEPDFDSIADGSYPVSRPLYFYVKKDHINMIPGIKEYLAEFTSEKAWGDDGYLAEKGMIPLNSAKRKEVAAAVKSLQDLQL